MSKKKQDSWFKVRKYLHFDLAVSQVKAKRLVTNAKAVSQHAFYPLINYTVETKKVAKDPITNKVVSLPVKQRPISYASHMDSQIYAYYSKIISQKYETKLIDGGLDESILAFRSKGKCNIDFALDAFNDIKEFGDCCVLALDITKFFDTLDHQTLKDAWCSILGDNKLPGDHYNIYKSLTKFSFVNRDALYSLFGISVHNPNYKRRRVCEPVDFRLKVRKSKLICTNTDSFGIPQGTPISALLSNVYMFDFDLNMKEIVDNLGGKYYRYCDDMLFIIPSNQKNNVESIASTKISKLGLTINTGKTETHYFTMKMGTLKSDKPLQYLGFMFDGKSIFIRSSSLARYSNRMKRGVRLAKKSMAKHNNTRLSNGLNKRKLYKRKLYSRYTHLGKRNFITYGLRAAETMESHTIKKQLKPLLGRFKKELER